ncbi:hypothetical protein GGR10_000508 [Bartonella chomelii]|uniref:Uncharacterized protein n=1 Tax=Bartonella chomelii TaxID=236402 RepID=A0ABR6E282_9HYPH|nr:hypothetical protein [Bartonella chomelii]
MSQVSKGLVSGQVMGWRVGRQKCGVEKVSEGLTSRQ